MMKFIGDGKNIVPGIPPRDLTAAEVKQYGKELLLATGLYQETKPKAKQKAVKNG